MGDLVFYCCNKCIALYGKHCAVVLGNFLYLGGGRANDPAQLWLREFCGPGGVTVDRGWSRVTVGDLGLHRVNVAAVVWGLHPLAVRTPAALRTRAGGGLWAGCGGPRPAGRCSSASCRLVSVICHWAGYQELLNCWRCWAIMAFLWWRDLL